MTIGQDMTRHYLDFVRQITREQIEAEFARIAIGRPLEPLCVRPGGHDFVTSCGETKCRYCPKIAWR